MSTTPAKAGRERRDAVWALALGVIVLAGLLLRLPRMGDSLFSDELVTAYDVFGRSLGGTVDAVQSSYEVTPPLFHVLANLAHGVGDAETGLRIVSLVCGVAAIPLTWRLGVLALDRRAATVGAAVLALTPFLIFYASEARAYSLAMVLLLGTTLALWHALHGGTRAWWLLYAALTAAAMYTHYTTTFVLIAQATWALAYHRAAWRSLIGANVLAAIAWLPWFSSFRADQDNPATRLIGILDPFGWHALTANVSHWAFGTPYTVVSVRDVPGDVAIALIALGVAAAVAAVGWELRRRGGQRLPRPTEGQVLVGVLALAAPVLGALYSAVDVSVFAPRNLTGSSPGLALALGALVTWPRAARLWMPAAALLLAGFAIGALRMTTDAAQRPDFAGAIGFIQARGGTGATIVDVSGSTPGPITHLDAAAAPGEREIVRPVILRLGRPQRTVELIAAGPGGGGQFSFPPETDPREVARRAERSAHGREIYLVRFGAQPASASPVIPPFLAVLAPRYAPVAERRFDGGFGAVPVSVMVLRRRAAR